MKSKMVLSIFILIIVCLIINCSKDDKFDSNNIDQLKEIFYAFEINQGNPDFLEYKEYVVNKYNLTQSKEIIAFKEKLDLIRIDQDKWNLFLTQAMQFEKPKKWKNELAKSRDELKQKEANKAKPEETKSQENEGKK